MATRLKAFLVGLEFAGVLIGVGGVFIWSHLRFRWSWWPRTLSVAAMIGLAGPGAIRKMTFTLWDLGIDDPSDRDAGFFTYIAVLFVFLLTLAWVVNKTNPPPPKQSGGGD